MLILLCLLISMNSCLSTKREQQHIGSWVSRFGDKEEASLFLIFDETTVKLGNTCGLREGKYIFDYSQVPVKLEIFPLSQSNCIDIQDSKLSCIIEFINEDSFKICGVDSGDNKTRTHTLEEKQTIIFNRVNKK